MPTDLLLRCALDIVTALATPQPPRPHAMASITDTAKRIELGMSNLTGGIDAGLDDALRADTGHVYAQHAAWNFCGYVWFDGQQFVEEVWIHRSLVEELRADTLHDLMRQANEKYGDE